MWPVIVGDSWKILHFIEIWLALQAGRKAYDEIRELSLLSTRVMSENIVLSSNDYSG